IGTAEGQHPQSAANALTTAIATAQALANNPTTQTAVDNMVTTLNTAITTFLNTVNPAEGVVDKSSLASTIALAQTTHNAAKEGSSSGEYTVGSKAILQNAITNAQTVHNNTLATQAQVNQAVTTLQNALATFQNSLIGVDKSILQTTIMAAQQKYDNADEGNLVGQYPEGTKQELLYEITIAQSVLASTTATQGQIDLAVTTLQAAMDLFDTQINPATISKDELEALITQAEALHADATHSYPLLETVEFYHAIQAAIEVYENNSLLQAHINNAVADLQAAIERYENSRIIVSIDDVENSVVRAYPNPVITSVVIESNKTMRNVVVIGMQGNTLNTYASDNFAIEIPMNNYAQGIYILQIMYADGTSEFTRISKQ
ncbi:MAG: T9SS type A sorting domain-containing protein, partial [Bacteroidales bacterium]|nr:T9SS type A sorting domain-containing protein [Bacteroidales bacterium]